MVEELKRKEEEDKADLDEEADFVELEKLPSSIPSDPKEKSLYISKL